MGLEAAAPDCSDPLVSRSASRRFRNSSAGNDKGTTCLPVFVCGRFYSARFKSMSAHFIVSTLVRRWPVKGASLMKSLIFTDGSASSAAQNLGSSSAPKNLSRHSSA